jgi:hypothetical protein
MGQTQDDAIKLGFTQKAIISVFLRNPQKYRFCLGVSRKQISPAKPPKSPLSGGL